MTRDESHHPCSKGSSAIIVQAQSKTEIIKIPITDNQDGSYTGSLYLLSVMLNGKPGMPIL